MAFLVIFLILFLGLGAFASSRLAMWIFGAGSACYWVFTSAFSAACIAVVACFAFSERLSGQAGYIAQRASGVFLAFYALLVPLYADFGACSFGEIGGADGQAGPFPDNSVGGGDSGRTFPGVGHQNRKVHGFHRQA